MFQILMMEELIKINIDDTPKKSVNFGPGAEMLMNPNKNKGIIS